MVLSHFHCDHINGIKLLKGNKVKVRQIIIPKLELEDKVLYLGYFENLKEKTKNSKAFGLSLDEYISIIDNVGFYYGNDTTVVQVSRDPLEEGVEGNSVDLGSSFSGSISHDTEFCLKKDEYLWIFKFYVDKKCYDGLGERERAQLDKLSEEMKTNGLSAFSKENKDEALKLYKEISKRGSINPTSLSMYSGPIANFYSYYFSSYHERYGACLLNGDANLKDMTNLKNYTEHFSAYSDQIWYFGIPHHGSHHNMSRAVLEFAIRLAIIQSGENNKYGHPSFPIIRLHLDNDIPVKVITEASNGFCFSNPLSASDIFSIFKKQMMLYKSISDL